MAEAVVSWLAMRSDEEEQEERAASGAGAGGAVLTACSGCGEKRRKDADKDEWRELLKKGRKTITTAREIRLYYWNTVTRLDLANATEIGRAHV